MQPRIFHGRELEVEHIIDMFGQEASPKIVILGPGEMGKTTLARVVLHHPIVSTKYGQKFFVPCDSATNHVELAGLIGLHLELEPVNTLTKSIMLFFLNSPPSLLVLDNFETPWEPTKYRGEVEKFLSLLVGIPHLALIVSNWRFFFRRI